MHRLSAAKLEGSETIRAEFVDADEQTAFLLAVKANTDHGLPLSVADREAAAERILSWYPYWSDRAIAAIAGLAGDVCGRGAGEFSAARLRLKTRNVAPTVKRVPAVASEGVLMRPNPVRRHVRSG